MDSHLVRVKVEVHSYPTEAKAGRRAGNADLVVQVQVEPECDGIEVPLCHHLRQQGPRCHC